MNPLTEPGAQSALLEYVKVLRRRRWLVLVVVVIALVLAAAYVVHATKVYNATAQLELTPQVSSAVLQANNESINSAAALVDVPTAIEVIQSPAVAKQVSREVQGAPGVTASQVSSTNVVNVSVRSTSPQLAARAANAYASTYLATERAQAASAFSRAISTLQARIAALQQSIGSLQAQLVTARGSRSQTIGTQLGRAEGDQLSLRDQVTNYQTAAGLTTGGGQIIGLASPPKTPASPKPAEDLILGLILGLIVGISAAFVRERTDDRLRSFDDLADLPAGVAPLAAVPRFSRRTQASTLVVRDDPRSPEAEAFRIIRTMTEFLSVDGQVRLLQVTSPRAGDGKTTVASNLALALAQAQRRVILLDWDLRRPRVAQVFGVVEQPGFTSVIVGEQSLDQVLTPVAGIQNLALVPAGPVPPFPSELLASAGAQAFLEELSARCDVVVIDTPPVLPVTDAAVVASVVDAGILVIGSGVSNRRDVRTAIERLSGVQKMKCGLVLNRTPVDSGYGGYYYKPELDSGALVPNPEDDPLPTR